MPKFHIHSGCMLALAVVIALAWPEYAVFGSLNTMERGICPPDLIPEGTYLGDATACIAVLHILIFVFANTQLLLKIVHILLKIIH